MSAIFKSLGGLMQNRTVALTAGAAIVVIVAVFTLSGQQGDFKYDLTITAYEDKRVHVEGTLENVGDHDYTDITVEYVLSDDDGVLLRDERSFPDLLAGKTVDIDEWFELRRLPDSGAKLTLSATLSYLQDGEPGDYTIEESRTVNY